MIGLIIAAALIVLLAVLPVGLNATYNSDGALAYLYFGVLRFRIYPKDNSKKKRNSNQLENFETVKKNRQKSGGNLSDFYELLKLVFELLSDFRKKLIIKNLKLKWILCGGDPCDLSINYGRSCAAIGSILPHLERFFVIKNRDVEVECSFTAEQTLIDANVDMKIMLCQLLYLLGRHGFIRFKKYNHIFKKIKGGTIS